MKAIGIIILAVCTFVGCSAPKTKESNVVKSTTKALNEVDVTQIVNDSVKIIHFGRIKEGEVPFCEFSFRNTTNVPVVIVDCQTDCGCVVVDYPTKPIAVGEVGECCIEFHSTLQYGRRDYDVSFELSSGRRYNVLIEAEIE